MKGSLNNPMLITFPETLARLADSQVPLSKANLFALSRMTREEEQRLHEVWPDVADERRCDIIRSLLEMAEVSVQVDFNAVFRYCLEDPEPTVRRFAVEGLWEDEDVALMHRLVEMVVEDEAEEVRAAAATSLGRFVLLAELEQLERDAATLVRYALLSVIRNRVESHEVRRRALESIAYFCDEEIRGLIEAAYCEADEKTRASAVFAMGRSADEYWREIVLSELFSDSPEMRCEAARACGELEIRRAVQPLMASLNDPDREVQEAAIWALGQIGGPEARKALVDCCASDDRGLREAAEDALAELELGRGLLNIPLFEFGLDDDEDLLDEEFEELFGGN